MGDAPDGIGRLSFFSMFLDVEGTLAVTYQKNEYDLQGEVQFLTGGNVDTHTVARFEARDPAM